MAISYRIIFRRALSDRIGPLTVVTKALAHNLHWPLAEVAKKFGKIVHAILWLTVFVLSLLEEFCPPPRPEFCKLCAQITIGAHGVVESVAQRADIGLSVAHFSLVTDLCDLCDRYPPASQ